MTAGRLIWRSLRYFRAAHAALLAGMMLVTAVLTGALILGDSVRDSLRDLSARRRGGYEKVVTAPGFFSVGLAERAGYEYQAGLVLPGRVRSERTNLSGGVQLLAMQSVAGVSHQTAWITRNVAESLNVVTGDALLITLPAANGASEAVLARRDRTSLGSLRVTVGRVLDERSRDEWPPAFLAWFDLHPSQRPPMNVWLNQTDLQEALLADVPVAERIPAVPSNLLLVREPTVVLVGRPVAAREFPPPEAMTLEDYGLGLSRTGDEVILRSGSLYIAPQIALALHPFKASGQEVYTLLLDRVTVENAQVLHAPLNYVMAAGITGQGDLRLKDDEAAVNQWTADQLALKVGDVLQVNPYRVAGGAVAVADASAFKVAKILPMSGLGADPSLTPAFHGLTDAQTMAQWNPPAGFPFDRARVTPEDEAYWDAHKAAPKVFFTLIAAQRLVKPETALTRAGDSNGELTSLRMPAAAAAELQRDILQRLTPHAAGFAARPFAPDQPGSTDFAGLFLGLSGFLLIAALLLVVLLFRLAVEQRARQIGLLGALGFVPRRIGRMILAEGLLVAVMGVVLGLPAAAGYTRMLVGGLGTWWIGATGTTAIALHVHLATVALGGAVSLVAALLALAWTTRRLARGMPGASLSGRLEVNAMASRRAFDAESRSQRQPTSNAGSAVGDPSLRQEHGTPGIVIMAALGIVLALTPVLSSEIGLLAAPMAFLLSGFLLLTLAIVLLARLPLASRRVRQTLLAVATAGILRQRTRAVLCVALMASATFLLTSVTAFESVPTQAAAPPSPTGGYQLIITTQIPLTADLQTSAGRKLLGVPEDPLFGSASFTALGVQPGDDISCLNMTQPTAATLVGVPAKVLDRLAEAQRGSPLTGDAIPAAVDEQTAAYILHAGPGQRLPGDAAGRPIVIDRLLTDSIFQSYALIPEADFRAAFPAVTGSTLILVDCPPQSAAALQKILREHLDDYGVRVETTTERLAGYHAVADSYLAAFQFLGALALAVGALGLVVVLARNVIQRRAELALLQALGFARGRVTWMLVIEHGVLLLAGLALGVLTALLATLPQMRQVHLLPVAAATAVIVLAGLGALAVAAHLAMRQLTPAALRQE